jgi:jumonji domain-containing protein 2
MSETTCAVFYPDENELDDLCTYIQGIEKEYPGIGICKLVPPQNWYQRAYNLDLVPMVVDTPIRQAVSGQRGSHHVTSLELKTMTVKQFATYAQENAASCETVEERERSFWKSIGKGKDPTYGADIEGSLFQGTEHDRSHLGQRGWTLDKSLAENDLLRLLPDKIPGVNTTMLYAGMWRAMFAFHVEDLDLYSINYLHTGAAKSWYSILPERRARLDSIAEGSYAEELRRCREYMRHKTKLFSPARLKECGLPYDTVVQNAGEFVITFPGAYHAGFNHGFNLAEATNFATPSWLPLGRRARRCVCRPHSVHIDVAELEVLYQCKVARESALHPPTIVFRAAGAGSYGSTGRKAVPTTVDSKGKKPLTAPSSSESAARSNTVTLNIGELAHSGAQSADVGTSVKAETALLTTCATEAKNSGNNGSGNGFAVIDLTGEDEDSREPHSSVTRITPPTTRVTAASTAHSDPLLVLPQLSGKVHNRSVARSDTHQSISMNKMLGKRRVQPLSYVDEAERDCVECDEGDFSAILRFNERHSSRSSEGTDSTSSGEHSARVQRCKRVRQEVTSSSSEDTGASVSEDSEHRGTQFKLRLPASSHLVGDVDGADNTLWSTVEPERITSLSSAGAAYAAVVGDDGEDLGVPVTPEDLTGSTVGGQHHKYHNQHASNNVKHHSHKQRHAEGEGTVKNKTSKAARSVTPPDTDSPKKRPSKPAAVHRSKSGNCVAHGADVSVKEVKRGDVVVVQASDSYLHDTVGTITAVEGEFGRLHVKVSALLWLILYRCWM